jgi:hypothetical protein
MRRNSHAAVGLTIIVLSCGGNSSSSGEGASAEQACNDGVEARCSGIERCAPFFFELVWIDHATCATRSKINCPKSFDLPGTSATPSQLETCVQAVNLATCADIFKGIEACRKEPGMLANGMGCADHAQCQSRFCNVTVSSGCGVCADKVASGVTCSDDEECMDGQKCANIGTLALPNKICAAYRGAGESCSGMEPCTPDLACKAGTCQMPDAAGQACTKPPDSCDGVHGAACVAGVCKQISTAKPGESCGVDLLAQTATLCGGGSTCKMGTCQAPAEDGQACDAARGPHCQAPAYCDNGLCKLRDPTACK